MKQIQAWLGHSDYGTTANLYAHLDLEASLLISAEKLNNGLFGGEQPLLMSGGEAEGEALNGQGAVQVSQKKIKGELPVCS